MCFGARNALFSIGMGRGAGSLRSPLKNGICSSCSALARLRGSHCSKGVTHTQHTFTRSRWYATESKAESKAKKVKYRGVRRQAPAAQRSAPQTQPETPETSGRGALRRRTAASLLWHTHTQSITVRVHTQTQSITVTHIHTQHYCACVKLRCSACHGSTRSSSKTSAREPVTRRSENLRKHDMNWHAVRWGGGEHPGDAKQLVGL